MQTPASVQSTFQAFTAPCSTDTFSLPQSKVVYLPLLFPAFFLCHTLLLQDNLPCPTQNNRSPYRNSGLKYHIFWQNFLDHQNLKKCSSFYFLQYTLKEKAYSHKNWARETAQSLKAKFTTKNTSTKTKPIKDTILFSQLHYILMETGPALILFYPIESVRTFPTNDFFSLEKIWHASRYVK